MNIISVRFSLLLALIISCDNPKIKEYSDTPVSGEIYISVDETFKPIIDSQIATFQSIYNRANVKARYVPEADAFRDLLNDSSRLIIATRKLTTEENNYFESIPIRPKITPVAVDAIAFISHPENMDSVLSYKQVLDIFNGTIKNWNDINIKSPLKELHIVFDNKNSGTARYMKEHFAGGKEFPNNCFALNTNEEVINYCHENKNALGIIGVNWISDGDDPASLTFKDKIKVIGIAPTDTAPGAGRAYKPYQAYIAQRFYPFTREIYIISREARGGLGLGFSSFVAGEKGQLIFLKSGIMPATKPVRIVGFRNNE